MTSTLKAPFPYFGGKSRVAAEVWKRFGNPKNYVEPFFGSGAILLARPQEHAQEQFCVETANDACAYLSNFWRAVRAVPEEVAAHTDWPVSEPDLHARHRWLVLGPGREHIERVRTDPEYFDARVAGWWVWGLCQWIGSGWCAEWGVNWKQLPHLTNGGVGVHAQTRKLPLLGNSGVGVHSRGLSQQLPNMDQGGRGVLRATNGDIREYFARLSERFRSVRVTCGDWARVTGPSVTTGLGTTAIFLDPPYSQAERATVYAHETDCAADVRAWCLENGDNPLLRIAICGYEGEGHEVLEAQGWSVLRWKARGGYGSQGGNTRGAANSHRESIWFSPHCINPETGLREYARTGLLTNC